MEHAPTSARRHLGLIGAGLALALIAAACGSDAGVSEPAATTAVSASTSDAPEPTEPAAATTAAPPTSATAPPSTTTDTTATTTTSTVAPSLPTQVVGQTVIGTGSVAGITADGLGVWVLDDDPTGELGCEGIVRQVLYVQPLDGGERRLATDQAVSRLRIGPDGQVLLEDVCEGFFGGASVAVDGGDGRLQQVTPLVLPPDVVQGTLRWASPNALTYVARDVFGGDDSVGQIFEYDLGTQESFLYSEGDYWDAVVVSAGRMIQRTTDSLLVDGYDLLNLGVSGGAFVADLIPSPDGTQVAVNTFDGVTVLGGADLGPVFALDGTMVVQDWHPSGGALLLGPDATGTSLRLLFADGSVVDLGTPPPTYGAAFTNDGQAIVMATESDEDIFVPRLLLVQLG